MTLTLRATLLSLMLAGALAGCGSTTKLDDTPVETRTPTPAASAAAGTGGASTAAAGQSGVTTVDLSKSGANAGAKSPAERVVLFDFDSFAIKDEYRGLIEGHAKALSANKAKKMVVEGHTDERGGSEYNLALGQKRAESVTRALVLLGVGDGQLEAVSFGKERPVAMGHDEAAWALNRRAELKDR